jgi:hypothetical protein
MLLSSYVTGLSSFIKRVLLHAALGAPLYAARVEDFASNALEETVHAWDHPRQVFVRAAPDFPLRQYLTVAHQEMDASTQGVASRPHGSIKNSERPQERGIWRARPVSYDLHVKPDLRRATFEAELEVCVRLHSGIPETGFVWVELSARDLDFHCVGYRWGGAGAAHSGASSCYEPVPVYTNKPEQESLQICIPVKPVESTDRHEDLYSPSRTSFPFSEPQRMSHVEAEQPVSRSRSKRKSFKAARRMQVAETPDFRTRVEMPHDGEEHDHVVPIETLLHGQPEEKAQRHLRLHWRRSR